METVGIKELEGALQAQRHTMKRQELLRQIWREQRDTERGRAVWAEPGARRTRRREEAEEHISSMTSA